VLFKDPSYVVTATKVVNFLQSKKNVPAYPVAVTTYNFSGHLKGEYEKIFLRFFLKSTGFAARFSL
jgi:hypothetical protein